MADLRKELAELLNRHSREQRSDTPDYLLGEYLYRCLEAYEITVRARDAWHEGGIICQPVPCPPFTESFLEVVDDVDRQVG